MVPNMSYDITTIDELIDRLGGPGELAEAFGVSDSAICNWAYRQFIPPSWHVRLLYELRIRNLTADPALFEATEEQFAVLFPPRKARSGNVVTA